MSLLSQTYEATEHGLANFLGEDPNEDMVELVAQLVYQALQLSEEEGCWDMGCDLLLEKSSHYVQTDLDELGLADYVGALESALEDFNLL